MVSMKWKTKIDTLFRWSVTPLLSLIVGMLNTYHSQSVVERRELIKSVQASTVVNSRQDQSIHYLTEIVKDIRQNKKQEQH